MAYQQFYGNPYSPGVAAGVMEGAKERTEFARGVQRARLRAEQRRMSLAEAQFEWRKDEAQIEREREQRRFETTLQQKQKLLQNQRRREQIQQNQFEQQAEIDAKKARGEQMIRSLQAGAVPVDNDYQLGEGEVDFVNPLNKQRFVIRKPTGGDAVKYNEFEEESIRWLRDQADALSTTIDTYRERAEDLEAKAVQNERDNLNAKAKQQRSTAKKYQKEITEMQKELASVQLKRQELVEGVLKPERRMMEQYEPGPAALGALSAPEMIEMFYSEEKRLRPEQSKNLTYNEVIEVLERNNRIRKRAGRK